MMLVTACTKSAPAAKPPVPAKPPASAVPQKPTGTVTCTLSVVGDIMMHMPQVTAGKKSDGTYDFKDVFSQVKPYIEAADLAFCNLETTIGPREKGFTGYPTFKSPEQILPALKYAGFDVVTTANNHAFDSGEFGVKYTLDKLDEYGFSHTGRARTQAERDKILVVESKGVKFGVISYTYGTNGMEGVIDKAKRPFMVNLIADMKALESDVKRARESGVDVIVAAMHWGDEYVRKPNQNQKKIADALFASGVDIIFGSHPHVLQPMEKKSAVRGDGSTHDAFVIYSLGNFVSNQTHDYIRYTDSGAIVSIDVTKDFDTGTIRLSDPRYVPTWVNRSTSQGRWQYQVVAAGSWSETLEKSGKAAVAGVARSKAVWKETTDLMGQGYRAIK